MLDALSHGKEQRLLQGMGAATPLQNFLWR